MFNSYKEAQEWISAGVAAKGRAFTASDEYKAAYPAIQAIYKKENAPKARKARVEMPLWGSSLLLHAAGMK